MGRLTSEQSTRVGTRSPFVIASGIVLFTAGFTDILSRLTDTAIMNMVINYHLRRVDIAKENASTFFAFPLHD
jgi:hypothetical protein